MMDLLPLMHFYMGMGPNPNTIAKWDLLKGDQEAHKAKVQADFTTIYEMCFASPDSATVTFNGQEAACFEVHNTRNVYNPNTKTCDEPPEDKVATSVNTWNANCKAWKAGDAGCQALGKCDRFHGTAAIATIGPDVQMGGFLPLMAAYGLFGAGAQTAVGADMSGKDALVASFEECKTFALQYCLAHPTTASVPLSAYLEGMGENSLCYMATRDKPNFMMVSMTNACGGIDESQHPAFVPMPLSAMVTGRSIASGLVESTSSDGTVTYKDGGCSSILSDKTKPDFYRSPKVLAFLQTGSSDWTVDELKSPIQNFKTAWTAEGCCSDPHCKVCTGDLFNTVAPVQF